MQREGDIMIIGREDPREPTAREIDPNVALNEIDLKSVRMSCTVLSPILKPKPIAVAEDLISGSSSCPIAVTAVK